MKAFLTTAYKLYYNIGPPWLLARNTLEENYCTDDPALADVIIFVESHNGNDPYFRRVVNHPLNKQYPGKCVLYHDADRSITTLPTISPSIETWQFDPRHKRSFHYIARVTENKTIDQSVFNPSPAHDFLYSLIGASNSAVRSAIFRMPHPTNTFLKNTTGKNAWELSDAERIAYENEYLDVMYRSSFILAPRGIGSSSYRLFEAMQVGRVPVIISDAWVEIPGIDWNACSIRIPEANIGQIPAILNERRDEAVEMGRVARITWENNFSPGVALRQISIAAMELIQHRYTWRDALNDYSQFIRSPWHFKNLLRYKKNQFKRKFHAQQQS